MRPQASVKRKDPPPPSSSHKESDFIRDSVWSVDLPPLPLSAKSINFPFSKDRFLKPVAPALDFYARSPILSDLFYMVPADALDPMSNARPKGANLHADDESLLVDITARKAKRVKARKLVDRPVSPRKAKIGESAVQKSKKIIVERVKPPKNLEAFVRFVEDTFVDFSVLEHESNSQLFVVEAHPFYLDEDQVLQFCEPFIRQDSQSVTDQ
jgi:hypothetical protein